MYGIKKTCDKCVTFYNACSVLSPSVYSELFLDIFLRSGNLRAKEKTFPISQRVDIYFSGSQLFMNCLKISKSEPISPYSVFFLSSSLSSLLQPRQMVKENGSLWKKRQWSTNHIISRHTHRFPSEGKHAHGFDSLSRKPPTFLPKRNGE